MRFKIYLIFIITSFIIKIIPCTTYFSNIHSTLELIDNIIDTVSLILTILWNVLLRSKKEKIKIKILKLVLIINLNVMYVGNKNRQGDYNGKTLYVIVKKGK